MCVVLFFMVWALNLQIPYRPTHTLLLSATDLLLAQFENRNWSPGGLQPFGQALLELPGLLYSCLHRISSQEVKIPIPAVLWSLYTLFFSPNVLWYCHLSLPRIMNSITLWWFSFKLSTTIRILPIPFLLISTKSKWASHSNFLHLKKLNYPQHLLHLTQTSFSKLNFLTGFSIAFLTNVNEHNFYISVKIAIAWFFQSTSTVEDCPFKAKLISSMAMNVCPPEKK